MSATVLYRKYRPQSFAEVRNQEHIVSVLEGAITKGTIPHALLFAGTRGTGKTTLARLFAQALQVSEVDVYEIDAASNRGIDDIRELREAVHTVPYESPYKVYIIDEVHMLTKEAFNALLKTLEEPPAHVIFILATTEEQKLPDTILSRCQTFTMREPTRAQLAEAVTDMAKKEGFTLEADAADLIAVAADGSFRDAFSILQKVILASGDTLGEADEVAAIIGAPTKSVLADILLGIHESDSTKALTAIATAAEAHVDMELLTRLILERMRAIMLIRNLPQDSERIIGAFSVLDQETVQAIAKDTSSPINSHTLLRFLRVGQEVKTATIPPLPLELAIIDVTTPTQTT